MGVVHHSNYFVWLEFARTEFLESLGFSYKKIEDAGVMFPVVDCYAKFIESAKYGDTVEIEVTVESASVARCKFAYKIIDPETSKILAMAFTSHAFVGPDFRPINLKKKMGGLYDALSKFCR
jgi:acyl-CoA thioester hydrolase